MCVSVSASYPKRNLSYSNNHFATKKKSSKNHEDFSGWQQKYSLSLLVCEKNI